MRSATHRSRSRGFTLIELVIVMGILVMVLTATYRLIVDCIDAERTVDKLTLPEKVAEGILSLFRADVSGTIWRHSGKQVFYVIDQGSGRDARDEIRFLSTVEPTPVEDPSSASLSNQTASLRTITGLVYFLKQNQGIDGVATFTLYRKEIIDFLSENPLNSPGVSYEVYDKCAYLSIECYDGYDSVWLPSWDSEAMIQDELAALEAEEQANDGIARITDRQAVTGTEADTKAPGAGAAGSRRSSANQRLDQRSNPLTQSAPGVDPALTEGGEMELLPPAAVPVAVRIEIGIYAGQGSRIERDGQGNPILKTYATIVPILTSQRIRIESEELDEAGLTGEDAVATDGTGGATGVNVNDDKLPGGNLGGVMPAPTGAPGRPIQAGPGGGRARQGNGGRARGGAPPTGSGTAPRLPRAPGRG